MNKIYVYFDHFIYFQVHWTDSKSNLTSVNLDIVGMIYIVILQVIRKKSLV